VQDMLETTHQSVWNNKQSKCCTNRGKKTDTRNITWQL